MMAYLILFGSYVLDLHLPAGHPISKMKLLLVGLLATAAQGGSLSRPRRTLPVPDCSMS